MDPLKSLSRTSQIFSKWYKVSSDACGLLSAASYKMK